MMVSSSLPARAALLMLAIATCGAVAADKPMADKPEARKPEVRKPEAGKSQPDKPKDVFAELKFRNLGPAIAGGRVSSVAGVPGDPRVYYVGAGGGGVFKTSDGGLRWKAVFEHEATSSIGAIAVAAMNPNLVWVGTGEANIRNDVIPGAGVYLSTDAGKSWTNMGLKDVGQIGRIVIDPHDPNHVSSRRWATSGARIRSAACSSRTTAAGPGRGRCT